MIQNGYKIKPCVKTKNGVDNRAKNNSINIINIFMYSLYDH